jgi:hypothetical protein
MKYTITGRNYTAQAKLAEEAMRDFHRTLMGMTGVSVTHVPPDGYLIECDTKEIEQRIVDAFMKGWKANG